MGYAVIDISDGACEKFISGVCGKGKHPWKVGLGDVNEEFIRRDPEGSFDGDKDDITVIEDRVWGGSG